jgi:hypothetical protein
MSRNETRDWPSHCKSIARPAWWRTTMLAKMHRKVGFHRERIARIGALAAIALATLPLATAHARAGDRWSTHCVGSRGLFSCVEQWGSGGSFPQVVAIPAPRDDRDAAASAERERLWLSRAGEPDRRLRRPPLSIRGARLRVRQIRGLSRIDSTWCPRKRKVAASASNRLRSAFIRCRLHGHDRPQILRWWILSPG